MLGVVFTIGTLILSPLILILYTLLWKFKFITRKTFISFGILTMLIALNYTIFYAVLYSNLLLLVHWTLYTKKIVDEFSAIFVLAMGACCYYYWCYTPWYYKLPYIGLAIIETLLYYEIKPHDVKPYAVSSYSKLSHMQITDIKKMLTSYLIENVLTRVNTTGSIL